MTKIHLGGGILASVSRSFYLSIRILPEPLREVIALAYLLARTSDTLADTETCPPALRRALLAEFAELIRTPRKTDFKHFAQEVRPAHPGEQVLLENIGACLDWLADLPESRQSLIRNVLERIIHGQDLDLARFGTGFSSLETGADLEEYTYLVAGCVGEFWAAACTDCLPAHSGLALEVLLPLARDFGKALQLVNILRDLPKDLRANRCYLPRLELAENGVRPEELLARPELAKPVTDRWTDQARVWLENGARYIDATRPIRLRMACYLPWDLARQTLDLIQSTPPLLAPGRIKVNRTDVYRTLVRSVFVAVENRKLALRGGL
jgi:farnesyl-diphosphate farnesyltransferase